MQIRATRHTAVFVKNFNNNRGRFQPRQARQITTGFGMSSTCQYTARLRHQRKYMTGLNEILRPCIGLYRRAHGVGAIIG